MSEFRSELVRSSLNSPSICKCLGPLPGRGIRLCAEFMLRLVSWCRGGEIERQPIEAISSLFAAHPEDRYLSRSFARISQRIPFGGRRPFDFKSQGSAFFGRHARRASTKAGHSHAEVREALSLGNTPAERAQQPKQDVHTQKLVGQRFLWTTRPQKLTQLPKQVVCTQKARKKFI